MCAIGLILELTSIYVLNCFGPVFSILANSDNWKENLKSLTMIVPILKAVGPLIHDQQQGLKPECAVPSPLLFHFNH